MDNFANFIIIFLCVGVAGLLCSLSCFIANISKKYWNDLKLELMKRNKKT